MLEQYPNDLNLVHKNFPLQSHAYARKAAVAALAAHEQGKYWEFHKKLFKNFRALNDQKIDSMALELGLDMEKFNQDKKSPIIHGLIERDLAEGRRIEIRGIPTVLVNGKILKDRTAAGFQEIIEAERNRSK